MQFALTFNSPSSNHLIETSGMSKREFLTLLKGVIQSIRCACSAQKPFGSSIERLYMVLYASSSTRARAAVAGGMGTNSVICDIGRGSCRDSEIISVSAHVYKEHQRRY